MSHTAIHITSESGEVSTIARIHNAWRGAMFIWDTLGKFKLHDRSQYWNAVTNAKDVWELFETKRLNRTERLVLGSTFDRAMVKKENLNSLAREFEEFNSRYNPVGARPNSLSEQADVMRKAAESDDCYALFWTQTSVSDDVWMVYENEDEPRWYDITRDTEHFYLFDMCNEIEKKLRADK